MQVLDKFDRLDIVIFETPISKWGPTHFLIAVSMIGIAVLTVYAIVR